MPPSHFHVHNVACAIFRQRKNARKYYKFVVITRQYGYRKETEICRFFRLTAGGRLQLACFTDDSPHKALIRKRDWGVVHVSLCVTS